MKKNEHNSFIRKTNSLQKAHKYALAVYNFTSSFPRTEIYGLVSQHRRAAVSVGANIAESFKRVTPKEKVRFLNIAQGSLEECKYYEILAHDLAYGNKNTLNQLSNEASFLRIHMLGQSKTRFSKAFFRTSLLPPIPPIPA